MNRDSTPNPDSDLIYLDHAATTPVDPEVMQAMLPFLAGPLSSGNPSSIHSFGRAARTAVDEARDQVARLIGADYSEITFTGSGTEADNLALIGTLSSAPAERRRLVTTTIEHQAVLNAVHFLEAQGCEAALASVEGNGCVSLETLAALVTDRTTLVSVMMANNEIGTIQPVMEIAALAHSRGALFHTDAVQAIGLLPIGFRDIGCDLMSISAHKIYGPKGVGALAIRQGTRVAPIIYGGAQEREKRAGTENVPGIVGFGKAAELALRRRQQDAERLAALRDGFIADLQSRVPGVRLNGDAERRLPNSVNVSIQGVDGPTLLMNLDRQGVAASSGSACSSGSIEPSHVLVAIGLKGSSASSGIRFTLGRNTTAEELSRTVHIVEEIVSRLSERKARGGAGAAVPAR